MSAKVSWYPRSPSVRSVAESSAPSIQRHLLPWGGSIDDGCWFCGGSVASSLLASFTTDVSGVLEQAWPPKSLRQLVPQAERILERMAHESASSDSGNAGCVDDDCAGVPPRALRGGVALETRVSNVVSVPSGHGAAHDNAAPVTDPHVNPQSAWLNLPATFAASFSVLGLVGWWATSWTRWQRGQAGKTIKSAGATKQSRRPQRMVGLDRSGVPRCDGTAQTVVSAPLDRFAPWVPPEPAVFAARPPQTLQLHFFYASPICEPTSSERLPDIDVMTEYNSLLDAVQHSRGPSASKQEFDDHGRPLVGISVATFDALSRVATTAPSTPERVGASAHRPHQWWHIAAHCVPSSGDLVLEDENGCAHRVRVEHLGPSLLQPPVGVCVLSCASLQTGRALLARGVAFAVVSTGSLLDAAARRFATYFYRVLLSDLGGGTSGCLSKAVRRAFEAAKAALQAAPRVDVCAEASKVVLLEQGDANRLQHDVSLTFAWPAQHTPCDVMSNEDASSISSSAGSLPTVGNEAWRFIGDETSQDTTSKSEAARLGDMPVRCEDFIGRAVELRALMRSLGPQGRRILVLHGPAGIGKSALCAEFCRFATLPGRIFSPIAKNSRDATPSTRSVSRLMFVWLGRCQEAGIRGKMRAAARMLAQHVEGLAASQRGCLVVDGAEAEPGCCEEVLADILAASPHLCVLLVRRSPVYRLGCASGRRGDTGDQWKVVNLELRPVAPHHAARIFLQRIHRPLYASDVQSSKFAATPAQDEPVYKGACEAQPLRRGVAIQMLVEHNQLVECQGNPRAIVRFAASVTPRGPSLSALQPPAGELEA